jgi:hypothetical protein
MYVFFKHEIFPLYPLKKKKKKKKNEKKKPS